MCGGELYTRDDDKESVILKRLEVYRAQTEPLINYYAKQKGIFFQIKAQGSKSEILHNILEVLGAYSNS